MGAIICADPATAFPSSFEEESRPFPDSGNIQPEFDLVWSSESRDIAKPALHSAI
jgi:hypothetical protein